MGATLVHTFLLPFSYGKVDQAACVAVSNYP